jgi:hypothetical protein
MNINKRTITRRRRMKRRSKKEDDEEKEVGRCGKAGRDGPSRRWKRQAC